MHISSSLPSLKTPSTFQRTSTSYLPWLTTIYTKTSAFTHTIREISATENHKSPLKVKVIKDLDRGSFQIRAGTAPAFGQNTTLRSTQESASYFNLYNKVLIKCTSLFLSSFTHNAHSTTDLQRLPKIYTQTSTYILRTFSYRGRLNRHCEWRCLKT